VGLRVDGGVRSYLLACDPDDYEEFCHARSFDISKSEVGTKNSNTELRRNGRSVSIFSTSRRGRTRLIYTFYFSAFRSTVFDNTLNHLHISTISDRNSRPLYENVGSSVRYGRPVYPESSFLSAPKHVNGGLGEV
jgi:hypothetical protein